MSDHLERIRRDGFTLMESLLAPAEVAELVDALRPHEAVKPLGRNNFEGERSQRVYSLAGKGEVFMRLACHPAILEILDALLLPNFLLSNLQSIRLHPGETAQPWHSDDSFYDVPRPHEKPLAVSVIWALEDFTEDNGATEVVRGSHRWANEHPDERAHTSEKSVMPPGSALVFDASLWHRGGANRSSGTRLAISPQYCQPWLRQQESQLLIAPPAVAQGYSARARAMLGYSIHPPFLGQVDGMHPLRLVDPSYRQNKTRDAEVANRVLARPGARLTAD
jgi:ectoine hydroxylase-related dioxygenase (phytanoyl-CoA dioxygenase family)